MLINSSSGTTKRRLFRIQGSTQEKREKLWKEQQQQQHPQYYYHKAFVAFCGGEEKSPNNPCNRLITCRFHQRN